ncbi:MAG TPA: peptide-methionine (S)-S-oxide reductase MsrA [Patescibacteria group bacterium]
MLNAFAEVTSELTELHARPELKQATFAGGCFWCMEGPFEAMAGVVAAVVGFAGGKVENPSYEQVTQGGTGHREAVQVFYDPAQVSYRQLVETYFWQIDPTDPYGQFADQGDHYRTAIFYHDEEQKKVAEEYITFLSNSGRYHQQIVVEVLPYKNFFPAEDYHQQFYLKQQEYYQQYKKGSGREEYIRDMQQKYKS